MSWVRFPVSYVFILAVIVLPAGPGPISPPRPPGPRARLSHRVWTVTVTGQSWWTVTVTGRPKPGPGPQADSVHRDSHAHVNRNPSLDHGWLVRRELWATSHFQAQLEITSLLTTVRSRREQWSCLSKTPLSFETRLQILSAENATRMQRQAVA